MSDSSKSRVMNWLDLIKCESFVSGSEDSIVVMNTGDSGNQIDGMDQFMVHDLKTNSNNQLNIIKDGCIDLALENANFFEIRDRVPILIVALFEKAKISNQQKYSMDFAH